VKFFILTKRAERIEQCLPYDWGEGYENVSLNVTCENQKRADERIPVLERIPARHKGIMTAPMISEIHIEKWLAKGFIEEVVCGGENYDGARECHYEWVKSLSEQCKKYNTKFTFIETGTYFVKDGKKYKIPGKRKQSELAYKSGLSHSGAEYAYRLVDSWGIPISDKELYSPQFCKNCDNCGSRPICNGCTNCGKCKC
ncbi:MAG: phage Gp37/Gp68 family protein, partial [Eubacterium sp.]|nr:phage Gp37/Gp68 family protein [Eubacterium sp.]